MGDRRKYGAHSAKRQKSKAFAGTLLDKLRSIFSFTLIVVSVLAGIVFAQAATQLTSTLNRIYCDLNSIIPVVAFVLFVLSGVSYATGQFFGAEMRARAITWSMSMLTGAIIGLLITQFAQIIIKNLIPAAQTPTC
jgi:hypothetical protein